MFRFLFALLAFACYVSFANAEGDLTKSCFNMVAIQATNKAVPTAKTPIVAQATYHWEYVQVCNNGVCRIERRAVQDMPGTAQRQTVGPSR